MKTFVAAVLATAVLMLSGGVVGQPVIEHNPELLPANVVGEEAGTSRNTMLSVIGEIVATVALAVILILLIQRSRRIANMTMPRSGRNRGYRGRFPSNPPRRGVHDDTPHRRETGNPR